MKQTSNHNYKYQEIYDYYKSMITGGKISPGQKLPTEQAIQSLFGVSRITVTKAMNMLTDDGLIYRQKGNGTFVSEDYTRTFASPLPSNSIAFVSLIMSFNPTGGENLLLENIEREVRNAGFLLSISNTYEKPEEERRCILDVKDKAAGIIIYPSTSTANLDLFFDLFKEKYPIVFIDRYPALIPCTCISSDNYLGGFQIGEWFVRHHNENFAVLFHNLADFSSESDRYNGFADALKKNGIPTKNIRFFSAAFDEQDFHPLLSEILHPENPKNPITAVFACNDMTALQLITLLKKQNFSPSTPLVVAGFDGLYSLKTSYPFITVKQNYAAIGQTAAKTLLKYIREPHTYYTEKINIPIGLLTHNIKDQDTGSDESL